jgi:hypothetical protein
MQLWFCLATFPVQARKLYASLIAAGLRKDKEITADELVKLEYLDWVGCHCRIQRCTLMFSRQFIKETQRLYNPACKRFLSCSSSLSLTIYSFQSSLPAKHRKVAYFFISY